MGNSEVATPGATRPDAVYACTESRPGLSTGARSGSYERLLREGVIVRPMAGYGLPDYVRISGGFPEENERFHMPCMDR